MPPYVAQFPQGTTVKIADEPTLRAFQQNWRWHNPLQNEQVSLAGQTAQVASVGYYHGGDVIYVLEDTIGVWHEACLTSPG